MNGWIILDKPLGLGSTQGVSAVKRALREGGYPKVKVGHGGTLDPLATGVLPIAIGEATKLCGRMLDASKVYDFTICFGTETAGLDAEGEVVAQSAVRPALAEVEVVLPRFTGPISQVPPAFSAIKIDGRRAYDRARAGETVEMKAREVEVYSLSRSPEPVEGRVDAESVASASSALTDRVDSITLTAHVSKGTYIRSLARDISHALGTVGHVSMLRRTRAGPFGLEHAISLDILEKHAKGRTLEDISLPLEAGLDDIPALSLTPDLARLVRQGRVLDGVAAADGTYCAWDGDVPVALVDVWNETVRVVRGFNL